MLLRMGMTVEVEGHATCDFTAAVELLRMTYRGYDGRWRMPLLIPRAFPSYARARSLAACSSVALASWLRFLGLPSHFSFRISFLIEMPSADARPFRVSVRRRILVSRKCRLHYRRRSA